MVNNDMFKEGLNPYNDVGTVKGETWSRTNYTRYVYLC